MKNIIMDLCRGNIESEMITEFTNHKLKELQELKEQNLNNLLKTLNDDEKEILEKYIACADESEFLGNEQLFTNAFSLGLRVASEAFINTEDMIEKSSY